MTKYVIDGEEFDSPKSVIRLPKGWQVRRFRQKSKSFSDRDHGGVRNAFNAAVTYLASLGPAPEPSILDGERCTKRTLTGVKGVSFMKGKEPRVKDGVRYVFHIILHGSKRTSVYVGNELTWRDNYDKKLAEASMKRFESFRVALGEAAALESIRDDDGATQPGSQPE